MQVFGLFDHPDKRGKYGLVHNIGLGGAVVVSLLRRPEFYKPGGADGRTRCFTFQCYAWNLLTLSVSGWGTTMLMSVVR